MHDMHKSAHALGHPLLQEGLGLVGVHHSLAVEAAGGDVWAQHAAHNPGVHFHKVHLRLGQGIQ